MSKVNEYILTASESADYDSDDSAGLRLNQSLKDRFGYVLQGNPEEGETVTEIYHADGFLIDVRVLPAV